MKRLGMALLIAAAALVAGAGVGAQSGASHLTSNALDALTLRNIGPTIDTGRVQDLAIDTKNPSIWYVASAFGGIWKTQNRGITFEPLTNGITSFTMCCVVIDPKDSDVVWVGSGENEGQRSAHYGDGVYKSTNGGKSFRNMGLKTSEHIGKIVIDPRNSNVVWVAAQGPLFTEGGGGERGLYKTTDGGETWTASLAAPMLGLTPTVGVTDIALDPKNPDIMYAGTYQRMRHVGQMIGGGPDGGLFQSKDAGKTWKKLTVGLPKMDIGRVALLIDPRKPKTVYAMFSATVVERGVYESDDQGATWKKISTHSGDNPAYFFELYSDPWRENTIWSVATNLVWSRDGGKTFIPVPGIYIGGNADPANRVTSPQQYVHVDYHGVGFDPVDRNHVLIWSDGGVHETYDMDSPSPHWRFFDNLPITQFYRVSVDQAKPFYHVCGGAQDNFSVCGPSRTSYEFGIRPTDWVYVSSGDGFQTRSDPEDPNIVYGQSQEGNIVRNDLRLGTSRNIKPRGGGPGGGGEEGVAVASGPDDQAANGAPGQTGPTGGTGATQNQTPAAPAGPINPCTGVAAGAGGAGGGRGGGGRGAGGGRGGGAANADADRPNWDTPYIISPHSHTRLYWASQYVYRTDDRGDTWTRISPDLTRQLKWEELPIMGKVWPNDGCSIDLHTSTTALSNIVSLDESPLLEGLIYAGTDDGLLQVTEDGGKNWRKVEDFPGVPKWTYVSDIFTSPRDSNVVFVAFNDWQRGNYKPYLLRSDDRGRTFKSVAGDLPDRRDIYSVIQDHINSNLLFAGTEFGLYTSVDAGAHWLQLKGNMPPIQVRDMAVQKQWNDLVLGTFGRGFWILDDYSPLREMTEDAFQQEARLFPLRDAVTYQLKGEAQADEPTPLMPNPTPGAAMTYSVGQAFPSDAKLVLTVTNETTNQAVRKMDLDKTVGLHRVMWNLQGDPVQQAGGAAQGAGAPAGRGGGAAGGRGGAGGRAGRGGGAAGAPQGATGATGATGPTGPTGPTGDTGRNGGQGANAQGAAAPPVPPAGGGGFGRGGGAAVAPGRYRATLNKVVGDTTTAIGPSQTFTISPLDRGGAQ